MYLRLSWRAASYAGLTRVSIVLKNLNRGWIAGSSPAMTVAVLRWRRPRFVPQPAPHQPIARPGEPRQRGVDTGIRHPGRRPAIDQPMRQPDHQERNQAREGDVGEKMPAERHAQAPGDDAEQRRGGK